MDFNKDIYYFYYLYSMFVFNRFVKCDVQNHISDWISHIQSQCVCVYIYIKYINWYIYKLIYIR